MSRDHARIRLDIWSDDDWRDLPSPAQWLYMYLLTSPKLSFCGVTDWRPARIAALAAELTADDIEYAAAWLEAGEFVIIDRDTEEALVRSFVKHDGLMKSPNIAKALVKDHAQIGSQVIRRVIVGQLLRLQEMQPGLSGWKEVRRVLEGVSMTVSEAFAILPQNPFGNPSENPSTNPFENRAELRSPFSPLHTPSSPKSKTPNITSPGRRNLALEEGA